MACEDIAGVSGDAARAWVSPPQLGKHVCFDGRYLHAAPADLARLPLPAEGHRQERSGTSPAPGGGGGGGGAVATAVVAAEGLTG